MKRFQECSKIVQIWRYRWYLTIPFSYAYYMCMAKFKVFRDEVINGQLKHTEDYDVITGKLLWGLLIGMAQSKMRWYHTMEEMDELFNEMRSKYDGE